MWVLTFRRAARFLCSPKQVPTQTVESGPSLCQAWMSLKPSGKLCDPSCMLPRSIPPEQFRAASGGELRTGEFVGGPYKAQKGVVYSSLCKARHWGTLLLSLSYTAAFFGGQRGGQAAFKARLFEPITAGSEGPAPLFFVLPCWASDYSAQGSKFQYKKDSQFLSRERLWFRSRTVVTWSFDLGS